MSDGRSCVANVRDLGQRRCLAPPLRREGSENNWTETVWDISLFMRAQNVCSSNTDHGYGNRINESRKFVPTFFSLLFIFVVHSFACPC
jgi:hypothetical protein